MRSPETGVIVEPDDRGRVSLAKLPGDTAPRYLGRRLADGSVLLQPAVVLTHQALEALLAIQSTAHEPRVGRDLGEVLAERNLKPLDPAYVETVRAQVAERRKRGVRSPADLTDEERQKLRRR